MLSEALKCNSTLTILDLRSDEKNDFLMKQNNK